jgi:3-oxoacyl-[acyl-carrier protein] reductase
VDLDFSGKQVVVVGGSSGIGNGIAHAFARRGAQVEVWGSRPRASDYDGIEGSDMTGLSYRGVDLSQPGAVDAVEPPPALDVLVLAQGTVLYERKEFEREGFRKVMEVNVMDCARRYQPALAAAQGKLIIVGSVASFRAVIGNPAYSASKAGTLGLVKTLGVAWAPLGIRVNGIAPGFVETKITEVMSRHPKRRAAALAAIPAGRFGTPEDMAGLALFLASPLSAYVTGQMIIADGGMTLS